MVLEWFICGFWMDFWAEFWRGQDLAHGFGVSFYAHVLGFLEDKTCAYKRTFFCYEGLF